MSLWDKSARSIPQRRRFCRPDPARVAISRHSAALGVDDQGSHWARQHGLGMRLRDAASPCCSQKFHPGRIRAIRENQRIIWRDACYPPSAWDAYRQPIQVATPA